MAASKILFVGTSTGWRGTEVHFVTLANRLAERGHHVTVLVRTGTPMWSAFEGRGVRRVHCVFRNAGDPRGAVVLVREVLREKPDLVVGSFGHEYWPVGLAARLGRSRAILFRHLPTRLKSLSARRLPLVVSKFVAVSKFVRKRLVEDGVPSAKIDILYNPIDLGLLSPDDRLRKESRATLGFAPHSFVVGFIGSLERTKGVEVLAGALNTAMNRSDRVRALWVGQAERHDAVMGSIDSRFRDRHRMCGWAADPSPFFRAMDLCVVPSVWEEPMGRVAIEAQAFAVPVLVSDAGGLPEAVASPSMVVNRSDTTAWANRILDVAAMPTGELERWGRECRTFVSRFDRDVICAEFESKFL